MKQFSRSALINVLSQQNPGTPRVVIEAMSDKALDAEFRTAVDEFNLQAIQKTYIYVKEG